ncbi:MAG TPA: D-cysteine desulfhydrase family protein [Tepidisphaeraceae bacterium]|jgi:D-cysteine desulfhydrase
MHATEPPRVQLAQLPTPIVEAKRLAQHFNIPKLLLKRDDLTGLETSGNKIRKLEYVIADALAQGADTLVTHGGFQSNHCRATAAIGAKLGLHVRLVLRSPSDSPDREGNLFLDNLFGAEISHHSPSDYNSNRKQLMDAAMDEQRRKGRKPYFFPVGASVPLGCWGYIRCVHELIEQLGRDASVDLFAPVSSSGTYAGIVLAKALFKLESWRMIGILVSDTVDYFQKDVRDLINRTSEQFNLNITERDTPLEFIDGYIGEGYAIPFPSAIEMIRTVARTEGICLDPTYTSKALVGCVETIQKGGARAGAIPVFIHTGGIFGLFARRDLF